MIDVHFLVWQCFFSLLLIIMFITEAAARDAIFSYSNLLVTIMSFYV